MGRPEAISGRTAHAALPSSCLIFGYAAAIRVNDGKKPGSPVARTAAMGMSRLSGAPSNRASSSVL